MENTDNLFEGFNNASTEIYKNNKEKGFWNQPRNVGEMLMLVTSELGEAMEAHRKGRFSDWQKFESLQQEQGSNLAFDLEKHLRAKTGFNKERPHLHGKNY